MKRRRTALERKLYWRAIVPAYLSVALWRGLQTWIRLKLRPLQMSGSSEKKPVSVSRIKADRLIMALQPADTRKQNNI